MTCQLYMLSDPSTPLPVFTYFRQPMTRILTLFESSSTASTGERRGLEGSPIVGGILEDMVASNPPTAESLWSKRYRRMTANCSHSPSLTGPSDDRW